MTDKPEIDDADPLAASPMHYRILAAVALGVVFLLQLAQNMLILNAFMVLLGYLALGLKLRLSPLIVLLTIVVGQIIEQVQMNRFGGRFGMVGGGMQVSDILLCLAVLTYLAAHYRLLALWHQVLPHDRRVRLKPTRKSKGPKRMLGALAPQPRPADAVTITEIVTLLLQVLGFVLLAQIAWFLLDQRWNLVGFPPGWAQFLLLAWSLTVGLFVMGHLFRYWRRSQMSRDEAQLLIQDVLWNETRGEQRRIFRWIIWLRMRKKEIQKPDA